MSVTARLWCVTLILLFVFIILSRFLRDGDEERDGGPETEMVTDDVFGHVTILLCNMCAVCLLFFFLYAFML